MYLFLTKRVKEGESEDVSRKEQQKEKGKPECNGEAIEFEKIFFLIVTDFSKQRQ